MKRLIIVSKEASPKMSRRLGIKYIVFEENYDCEEIMRIDGIIVEVNRRISSPVTKRVFAFETPSFKAAVSHLMQRGRRGGIVRLSTIDPPWGTEIKSQAISNYWTRLYLQEIACGHSRH